MNRRPRSTVAIASERLSAYVADMNPGESRYLADIARHPMMRLVDFRHLFRAAEGLASFDGVSITK